MLDVHPPHEAAHTWKDFLIHIATIVYGLLISEDNALILGSLLLFAVLAVVMVVTRKVDWYKLTAKPITPPPPPTPILGL
jgi:inner membrane protein involved in colicin E2 resistance